MIEIISNGSKWAGQAPDPVEKLLEVLGKYALDPSFEAYGNFIKPRERHPEQVVFWGNFSGLSHVFNIVTDEQGLIGTLTAAIRENQARQEIWR